MFIYHIMIKRLFSTAKSYSITITNAAWNKMDDIVKKKEDSRFLFSASSGGCNGYNYGLHLIDKEKYEKIIMMYGDKFKEATNSLLAQKLFKIEGVEGVL